MSARAVELNLEGLTTSALEEFERVTASALEEYKRVTAAALWQACTN